MEEYTLIEVKTESEKKIFLELPLKIYAKDSKWIRPLDSEIEAIFDPKQNHLFSGGEAIRWIVKDRHENCVGRIAAFYNSAQSHAESPITGGCGFFESIDNQKVANILFDAARDYLASKGMQAMDGPINFGSRDKFWGMLTEGFEYEPIYGMNYNLEYYQKLITEYGFKNYFNQHSYYTALDGNSLSPQVKQRAERLLSTGEYEFRQVTKSDFEMLPEGFTQIYNKAWSKFSGVTPMSVEDGKHMLKQIRPIMEERMIQLAFHKGKMIGFFIMIPDINGAIKHLKGKFGLLSKLSLLYHLKIRKTCKVVMGLIFSVTPEYQGRGVESGMINNFQNTITASKHHYSHMELAWTGDFNPLMMRMIEGYVGAKRYKMHTTFRYLFDREAAFTRAPKVSVSKKQEAADAAQNEKS